MERKLRILMLEDIAADAELVQRELREANMAFSATLVDTKDTFVRALEEFDPDIILADYSLPSFDGIAALAIATDQRPDVPFVFVSGAIGEERAIEALKNGAVEGERNNTAAALAGYLFRRDVLPAEALEILRCVNDSRFAPPLDEGELMSVFESIAKAELKRRGKAA